MPLQQTLDKVRWDIQNQNLGKARDRLHGLINSYPDHLELRKMLGDLYWQLQLPDMAGRYWYLEEEKDENMIIACQRFENQFNYDPMYMLFAIKYKGDLQKIEGTFAWKTLMDLHHKAKEKYSWYEHFQNKGVEKFVIRKYEDELERKQDKSNKWVTILLLILLVSIFCIGVITIVRWFF